MIKKKKKLTNFGRCCDVMVGVYVANRASDKITQLTDNVYLCRSGSVTDLVPHWLYHYSSFIFINYAWLIERVWTLIVCVCFFRLQILRLSPTMFATSFINTRQSISFPFPFFFIIIIIIGYCKHYDEVSCLSLCNNVIINILFVPCGNLLWKSHR